MAGTGMLPDAVVTDAAGTVINSGVVGALLVLAVGLLLMQQWMHRKDLKEERDAHEKTRAAQIEEIRNFNVHGRQMQEQQASLERVILARNETVEQKLDDILDHVRGRGRTA